MRHAAVVAIAAGTLALYLGVIVLGPRLMRGGLAWAGADGSRSKLWTMQPNQSPAVEIAFGRRFFNETPVYGAAYGTGRISCSNCHLEGGTAPYASPMIGIAGTFPLFSKRAARKITLEDRVQECMTRSENGRPLPHNSPEMQGLLAYIGSLSQPHAGQQAFVGRGLKMLPSIQADAAHGAQVYATQCAGCHGENGEGTRRAFPPLWGPTSFNDGAGMNGVDKLAAFVRYNMPHNRKGILSAQEAYDVAAFLHAQPRPAFNPAYEHY